MGERRAEIKYSELRFQRSLRTIYCHIYMKRPAPRWIENRIGALLNFLLAVWLYKNLSSTLASNADRPRQQKFPSMEDEKSNRVQFLTALNISNIPEITSPRE